jgi:adenine-specific DNA-methyltransferase
VSIKYVPQKGKNAGKLTQFFYRGPSKELFAWLRDIVDVDNGRVVKKDNKGNLWDDIQYNNLTKEGDIVFPNGKKPIQIMMDLQSMCCTDDDIILDFFSGSASTAHAVLQLNAEVGGNRKFILVQLPEETDEKSDSFMAGYKTIADIGKERIRRAGKKILEGECHEDWNKDVGFRALKIDTSNLADVYYTPGEVKQEDLLSAVDNIKPGRDNPEDLLFQVLVDWGVDLTLPIRSETIQGKTVFFVNEEPYDLIACFDTGITEEFVKQLARYEPMRVVFRDNGFVSDAVKINVDQIFRQLSPGTEVKAL